MCWEFDSRCHSNTDRDADNREQNTDDFGQMFVGMFVRI